MSAHRLHSCFANWLSIDINAADVQQTAAHCLFICTQLAIILTSCSLRSDVAQNSHASAHRMQASMQLCHFVFCSVPAVDIYVDDHAFYLSAIDRSDRTESVWKIQYIRLLVKRSNSPSNLSCSLSIVLPFSIYNNYLILVSDVMQLQTYHMVCLRFDGLLLLLPYEHLLYCEDNPLP